MSVVLYRDGERVLIPPQTIEQHLGNGYFLTLEESLGEEVPLKMMLMKLNCPMKA